MTNKGKKLGNSVDQPRRARTTSPLADNFLVYPQRPGGSQRLTHSKSYREAKAQKGCCGVKKGLAQHLVTIRVSSKLKVVSQAAIYGRLNFAPTILGITYLPGLGSSN